MITKNSRRSSAPIKWHGGKTYLANRIIDLMAGHTHYVEPFFGGGAVLFRKPAELTQNHSEVVNDVFGDLVNFWKVLKSKRHFPEFKTPGIVDALCQAESGRKRWHANPETSVERAVRILHQVSSVTPRARSRFRNDVPVANTSRNERASFFMAIGN